MTQHLADQEDFVPLRKESDIFRIRANFYYGVAAAASLCGGEVVVMAPSKEILTQAWKKLKSGDIDLSRAEETMLCGVAQAEKVAMDEEEPEDEALSDMLEKAEALARSRWDLIYDTVLALGLANHPDSATSEVILARIDKLMQYEEENRNCRHELFQLKMKLQDREQDLAELTETFTQGGKR